MKISVTAFILFLCFSARGQKVNESYPVTQRIDSFITALERNGQFSGAVVVAEAGRVLYKKGVGLAQREPNEPFTVTTQCYIGSISKQFTATGIVQLKEKGGLQYSDGIRKYFPDLPALYEPVTVLDLLHHTSGLPLFNDFPGMNQQDVYAILQQQNTLRFTPGMKFEYCNANYTLLGMLIEKLSGQTLDNYLTGNVFIPAGMKDTYVDSQDRKDRKRATGYYLFGDENNYSTYIGGAASVVSTAEDLYKWSLALNRPGFISGDGFRDMITPGKNQWARSAYGKLGYGFGWFIHEGAADTILQHDGGFAGFRAYIERTVSSGRTIVFVSNVRHELTGGIREALVNILDGKRYAFPKISAANRIMAAAGNKGMAAAIDEYRSLIKSGDSRRFDFSEREFNSFGYYMKNKKMVTDAILLFKFNTELFPGSGNAFDSLGEAYLEAGNIPLALSNYRRALALDPGNENAKAVIKKLESGK